MKEKAENLHTYLLQAKWPDSSLQWDVAHIEEIFSPFFLSGTCYSADLRRNLLGILVATIKAVCNLCSISSRA